MSSLTQTLKIKIKYAAKIKEYFPILRPVKPIKQLEHLPFSPMQAIIQSLKLRDVNEKIKCEYYRDRLVIVSGLPKSGSSSIASCITTLQRTMGEFRSNTRHNMNISYGERRYGSYMLANSDPNLRPELPLDFPDGGVMKYHSSPSGTNLAVLDLLGVKYFITIRHPADQLVAAICNSRKSPSNADQRTYYTYDPIHPLPRHVFDANRLFNDSLQMMIKDGYLLSVLDWMCKWLKLRDAKRSLVITYEELMLNPKEVLSNTSELLYGNEISDIAYENCRQFFEYCPPKFVDPTIYPHGYSGEIGVWKQYFSDKNIDLYNGAIRKALDLHPDMSLLEKHYPDLYIK